MQRILTAAEMREVDRLTIDERGIPGIVLMENAGARVYEFLEAHYSPLSRQRIVILCGKGNNGGDGFVVARRLIARGGAANIQVVLVGDPEQLRGDAAVNYRMLGAIDFAPLVVTDAKSWKKIRPTLLSATLVVDALLGTGLRGPAEGLYLDVIRDLNSAFAHVPTVAVDMPSGLGSDSGDLSGESVRATATVTFTAPKLSQVFAPACQRVGELRVASIGTAPSVIESIEGPKLALVEPSDFAPLFVPRKLTAHKGDFGHVLVVGGSSAKPGAALMAGTAALRAGAGLCTVATAAHATAAIVAHTPELMTEPAEEIEDGSMCDSAFRPSWFERKTVVAVGPGVGTKGPNQELVRRVFAESEPPLVVDADGLTALAADSQASWDRRAPLVVLTPHPGEMSRLSGLTTDEIQSRRIDVAREFAKKRQAFVVLKGFRTLIAGPDGVVLVNPSGTPALAKGGTGDILTGMIAGFLAQFPQEEPAVVIAAAVYLHGLAAELAVSESSELTLLATDILDYLPKAIESLRSG